MKIEEIEYLAVIKYLNLKGLIPTQIQDDMAITLGDDAPSFATVKRRVADFKRGRSFIEDEPRSGRPSTASLQANIDNVHQIVINDRRLTVRSIVTVIGISHERVENILTKELGMAMVSARWIPPLLNSDQKRTRLTMSKENGPF